ncbi:hypothetical protein GH733_011716, partial [Mirounga leonina]
MATAIREVGVWRQTRTLLLKNYLIKCRTKKSSVQEILFPLFFLFWLILISMMHPNKRYEEVPDIELNPMDKSMLSNLILGYTPVTNITRNIMQKVSTDHLPEGIVSLYMDSIYNSIFLLALLIIITEEYVNEKELLVSSLSKPNNFVGVVFKDFMSYELRFFPDIIPVSSIYMDSRDVYNSLLKMIVIQYNYLRQVISSKFTDFPTTDFMLKTNVSFWKELESTKAVIMGETAVVEIDTFPRGVILIYLVIAFSPFGYFLAIHIVAEKEKKLKEFLKIMGLHDTAFWYVIKSLLLSIFFALMLTPLFKKSKHVGIVEFLVTVAFGFVGLLIVFMESFPKSLVWLFSPFCQCTFLIGIAQVGEFGLRRSSLYFLKPSYWSKSKRNYKELSEGSVNGNISFNEIVEPVSSEFMGKEAIRISGIQKTYRKKGENVEALRIFLRILCHSLLFFTQILLLDEPTAGMDPCSRHIVWNLLKYGKSNRVTVFSTHFMDEADILADRKAVISQGMLKCVGSSIFLKSKWGIGYRLSMYIDRYCATEALSSLVKQHIPGATLLQQNDQQLVYSLPLKDMDKFAGLFSALDTHSNLGVISYGVSMTTLEDVFLKLEVEAEIDQADYSVFSQQPPEEEMDSKSFDEMEQSLLILSETKASLVSTMSLWKQQVYTIAKFHLLTLKRESKSVRSVLLLLLIFFAVQIFMFLVHRSFKNAVVPVKLVPDLYLLKPGDKPHKYKTSLLLQNSTDSDISDLTSFFTNRNIMVTMFNDSDYVSAAPHSAALNVMYSEKDYVFTAVFNSTMVCSLPVLMNIISNYYLYHLNVTESIQVWNTPFFQEITDIVFKIELYFQAALLGIIVTAMPPYFAMENAENHKIKAYTQLKLSGLLPSAYWIGQAIVDIPLFFLVLILMLGSLFAFHYGLYFYAIKFLSVTALVCIAVTEITFFMGYTVTAVLHYTFSIVIPIYPLLGCLICFIKISWKNIRKNEYTYNPWDRLLVAVISPYLQCVLWIFLLQYYEKKYGGRSIRKDPFFRTLPTKSKNRKYPEPPNNEDEDEDVKAERLKVKELMSCQCCEEVFLGDYSPEPTEDDDSIKYMGYCPQINPLWPDITLREHFEIYGAVKGMSSSDMKEVINRITNALDLKEHLQKTIKKLPVGIKRKLCFALSMLGNPHITLLDEPSTGMDPKAKQHMWRAIRTAFKNKKRAAILTTHYMEEAEAVCDRVAVMVSGQLRCIGTVQHLKSKFGKGYFLEIKLKEWIENLEVDRLQREIQYIFPNASRQESFSSILAYKIPKEDVPSLSQSFSKLEEAKHTFAIEEYSFSQATLEQ